MKAIKIVVLFTLFISYKTGFCQTFEVPRNYEYNTGEDYVPYEKDMIKAADWLRNTPFNEQQWKRQEVNKFVVKWIDGSPTVSVEIFPCLMDFEKKNEGMLILYMASCAKYVLANNYSKDVKAKQKAALQALIEVYKRGTGINKDSKMEKLLKADANGQLEEWIKKNMPS